MEILLFKDLGDTVSLGCGCSSSSTWRASNFNRKVPQGGGYLPTYTILRDRLNIFRVSVRRQGLWADAAMLKP